LTTILKVFFIASIHATSLTHLILTDLIIQAIFGEGTNYKAPHYAVISSYLFPLRFKYPQHPILKHPYSVFCH
jgi:hypothetical protein